MEPAHEAPSIKARDRQTPTSPKRILVETTTHLVPGDDFYGKLMFILNLICQQQWCRDYDPSQDRWNCYGLRFSHGNRRCFFLLDHGSSLNDAEVPILRYEWTGEALKPLPAPLPLEMQERLTEYPFTPPAIEDLPPRSPRDDFSKRRSVRRKLECLMKLSKDDIKFVQDHPDHAQWLKDHMKPRFWASYEAAASSLNREDSGSD